MPMLMSRVLREAMNPLGISPERFLIAYGNDDRPLGVGQIPPQGVDSQGSALSWELASVIVEPGARGKGLGSEIVRRLLARHDVSSARCSPVVLLTLEGTRGFYEALGFAEVADSLVPAPFRIEMAAGSIVANLAAGQKLICMSREPRGW